MNKIIGIIYVFIGALILFIQGYNYVFKTEKTMKQLFSHRSKFADKIADFLNISAKPPKIFEMRFIGWIAMIFSIFGLIMFLVNVVFKR